MDKYIKEIEKVLEDNAWFDDYGDLNISEIDYFKIAKAITSIPCPKCKELEAEVKMLKEGEQIDRKFNILCHSSLLDVMKDNDKLCAENKRLGKIIKDKEINAKTQT